MIRLDSDDWFHEIALFIMVNKLESNKNAGIAYSNYFYTNKSGNIIGIETKHKLAKRIYLVNYLLMELVLFSKQMN